MKSNFHPVKPAVMNSPHKIILVVNCGGATFKYKLYEMPTAQVLAVGHVDRLGGASGLCRHKLPGRDIEIRAELPHPDYHSAIHWMCEQLVSSQHGALESLKDITVVGHKIAHDGMKLGDCSLLG